MAGFGLASAFRRPGQGLLATQRPERFEDAGRDRRAGERHPNRLEDLLRLHPEVIDQLLQPARSRRVPRVDTGDSSSRPLAAAATSPTVPRLVVVLLGASNSGPARSSKSLRVCIFSCETDDLARQLAVVELLEATLELVARQPRAGSARSSSGASARRTPPGSSTPARGRSAPQLVGRHEGRALVGSPSRAARCSCAPPRAGSRRRGRPGPTPRRGASRASSRRAREAAGCARLLAAR